MRTDDFIGLLARQAGAVQSDTGWRRLALALGLGGLGAVLLMMALLGVNPALQQYVHLPAFWMKVAFVAALSAAGLVATQRLARPGIRLGRVPTALALPVLAMWGVAALVLVSAEPGQRTEAILGQTWSVCPLLVALLSAPVFAGVMWAMKGLAPTRLRLAGAAAGFVAGAVGALVYCLHCPELAPPFVGSWYLLGMLIPSALGAAFGDRLLRW